MKISIRKGVFETNSSSTHSISISSEGSPTDSIHVNADGEIRVYGEFGWEEDDHYESSEKLAYAVIYASRQEDKMQMLKEAVAEHLNIPEVTFRGDGVKGDDFGYTDHQSFGEVAEAFSSKETLINFIFNPNSFFTTGNDNN